MTTSKNSVVVALSPDAAFRLVCDAVQYPRWLVGAQSIRHVDADWPAVGTKFAHRIGVGPLAIPGSTTVRQIESPRLLVLAAGMGVLGESTVRFELTPATGGTEISIRETPRKGVTRLAARFMGPVVHGALWGRNQVSLGELAKLAHEQRGTAADERGAVAAGGAVVGEDPLGAPLVEGPNSL